MDKETPNEGQAATPAAEKPRVAVTYESLTFSDGTVIKLDPKDVVVFVGPNNAGKSAALRDLEQSFGASGGKVIVSTTVSRKGTADDLRLFLEEDARKQQQGTPGEFAYQGLGYSIYNLHIENFWSTNISQLHALFCTRIRTDSRINDSNPPSAIAILSQAPQHPIHMLYKDDRIEKRISGYFNRAFGQDLIVFRGGGASWPLLVGQTPTIEHNEDRISATYCERLVAATVPLQEQGDGMRAFASVILHMLAPKSRSILLLDEPEAFLHPPQARLIGEFIATERSADSQLFIATHSPDVLLALLNVSSEHLRVLRIRREGNVNRVQELDKAQAREISADPLMKYSGALAGVFHQRVIICESDADCMFYSTLLALPSTHGELEPDVLFVHGAGKHRMANLARALRALDVPVDVIADIDVLDDETVLKQLVTALGGEWSEISAQAGPLKKAIEEHKPWLNSTEVAKGVREALDEAPATGEFPRNLRDRIQAVFRKASPWDAVKDAGEAAIPSGQATVQWQAFNRLCKDAGLWIVPKGEMEGFCKTVGAHGPKWVQAVLEKYDLANSMELADAREFMKELWNRKNAIATSAEKNGS